jgi:hypothetical protein
MMAATKTAKETLRSILYLTVFRATSFAAQTSINRDGRRH